MDLALKKLWVGLLLFFCVEMVLSETGERYGPELKIDPRAIERIIQKSMTDGNILEEVAAMAAKNKASSKSMKGMKVKDFAPPEICAKLIPQNNIQMSVTNTITVAGKSFIGGNMELTMKSRMDVMIKMSKHPTKHIGMKKTVCEVELISYKTNLPSNMLPKVVNKFLNSTLGKLLPPMLCPAADKVVTFMETKIEAMFEKKPFGKNRIIWYEMVEEPAIFPDYNFIHLKVKFQPRNGEIIEVMPGPVLDDLPPKEEGKTTVYIPVSIVNVAVMLMDGCFNFVVTEIKGSIPTTDQLKQMWPEADLPAEKEVRIEITQSVNVTFTVASTGSYMTSRSKASFLSVQDGAELLSVDMVQECNASFDITDEQLGVTLESGSCRTTEISSPAENAKPAKDYMAAIMNDHIPQLNDVLNKNRVPLPSLLGVMYSEGEITLILAENMLVFQVMIEKYSESEMAEKMKHHEEKTKAK